MEENDMKKTAASILLILALILAGCGSGSGIHSAASKPVSEEKAASMVVSEEESADTSEDDIPVTRFASADESVSIEVAGQWKKQDIASQVDEYMAFLTEGCLELTNEDESESIYIMQVSKFYSNYIEDCKQLAQSTCPMIDIKPLDHPNISGIKVAETYSGKIDDEEEYEEGILLYGESVYSYYVILYAVPQIETSHIEFFNRICESFRETASEENNSTVESTDTIQWFNNTYAVLTVSNGWDDTLYGGLPANNSSQMLAYTALYNTWNITDRATADEKLEWLLTEGDRADVAEGMGYLAEDGFADVPEEERVEKLIEDYWLTTKDAQHYANMFALYEQYGENAVAGWDYSQAITLLSYGYLAGFYTEEESLDLSLEIAEKLQTVFDSWDSFMESYFVGYEFHGNDSSEQRTIYEERKAASDNPFRLDWNMKLEKSW